MIDKIIDKIDSLPPFPLTVIKLMRLMKDPDVEITSIVDTLKYDQALVSNILRICNSSYYSLKRNITNIKEAVVYIGISEIKKIAILYSTKSYFDVKKTGYESEKGELWGHVMAVSIISEKLNASIKNMDHYNIYISAILHDIGKLVLNEYVLKDYSDLEKLIEKEHVSFIDAEKRILGMDHAEIGERILKKWDFDQDICEAVGKHHKPHFPNDSYLESIIKLSDNIAIMMGFGTSADGLQYQGFSEICNKYDLNHGDIQNIMGDSIEEIKAIQAEYK